MSEKLGRVGAFFLLKNRELGLIKIVNFLVDPENLATRKYPVLWYVTDLFAHYNIILSQVFTLTMQFFYYLIIITMVCRTWKKTRETAQPAEKKTAAF